MTGTSFEQTIDYFLESGAFTSMQFGETYSQTSIAETKLDSTDSRKRIITVNARYQNEFFAYFIAAVSQEILHGTPFGPADEVIINTETGIVMTEVLADHPDLAYVNTELARRMNDYVEMFLNSRHPNSARPVIIAPDGLGLYPGSTVDTNKDIWTNFHAGGSSAAPPVSAAVLAGLGITATDGKYDQATAAMFEAMADPNLPPTTRLRVAVLLQLLSVDEIARKLATDTQRVIDTFKLQPLLRVIAKGQHAPPSP